MSPAGWVLEAGRYRARLVAEGPLAERLGELLVDLRSLDGGRPAGLVEVAPTAAGRYLIRSDGRLWDDEVAEADVADQVVRVLLRASLDAENTRVHLHAGAVTLGGRTIVLTGPPGSGKSTAIVALVRDGFEYVTDERLVVSADGEVCGFPKPVSLISGSFAAYPDLDPAVTGVGVSNGEVWQIPASSLGTVAAPGFRSPSLVVFVTYRPDASVRVAEIPAHTVAARLLAGSPDVIERGHEGAGAVVGVAGRTRAVEIEYSDVADLVAAVHRQLTGAVASTPLPPLALVGRAGAATTPAPDSPHEIPTGTPYCLGEHVGFWVFGEHAVAYDEGTGAVVELDEPATAWVQLLDDGLPLETLIAEVASAADGDPSEVRATALAVVHGLWSAGVVVPVRRR